MKKLIVVMMTGALSSLLIGRPGAALEQDQADKPQEGVEVLTRGPMHEAYASPESLDPKPSPIVPKQPPEPVPEMPPDQKPDGSQVIWISGYWAWDDDSADFSWISGFWRDVPPGKRWVPGHWTEAGGGWQWISGLWAAQNQTEVSYVPPPPPTLENGPSALAPEADQFYSPGCWIYVERQYRWRPGFWVRHRPNWVYLPAQYAWTPAGCVFVDGYWDYELTRRGLLFCPIRFTANVWTRPGWRFTPHYIVYPEVIVSALFVRPDYHRYCFGDYFGAKYVEHGFVPWVDYRLHKNIPEPLFNQYAYSHHKEANFERDLRKVYDDRRTGIAPRPPRNIAQQDQFLRDLKEHQTIKTTEKNFAIKDVKAAERNLKMTQPLTKVDRKQIPLKTLTPAAHAETIKTQVYHAEVKQVRTVTEAKILKATPTFKPTDAHQVGNLPVLPQHLNVAPHATLPTAPVIPQHIEKVVPKYEPPKAPKASPKPLHGSLSQPPAARTAQAEWLDGARRQTRDRPASAPLLM
jgi:hypothetical protein